ncbi:hypothetical protein JCM3766R1_003759 [Sporobolomyces carnicolor]
MPSGTQFDLDHALDQLTALSRTLPASPRAPLAAGEKSTFLKLASLLSAPDPPEAFVLRQLSGVDVDVALGSDTVKVLVDSIKRVSAAQGPDEDRATLVRLAVNMCDAIEAGRERERRSSRETNASPSSSALRQKPLVDGERASTSSSSDSRAAASLTSSAHSRSRSIEGKRGGPEASIAALQGIVDEFEDRDDNDADQAALEIPPPNQLYKEGKGKRKSLSQLEREAESDEGIEGQDGKENDHVGKMKLPQVAKKDNSAPKAGKVGVGGSKKRTRAAEDAAASDVDELDDEPDKAERAGKKRKTTRNKADDSKSGPSSSRPAVKQERQGRVKPKKPDAPFAALTDVLGDDMFSTSESSSSDTRRGSAKSRPRGKSSTLSQPSKQENSSARSGKRATWDESSASEVEKASSSSKAKGKKKAVAPPPRKTSKVSRHYTPSSEDADEKNLDSSDDEGPSSRGKKAAGSTSSSTRQTRKSTTSAKPFTKEKEKPKPKQTRTSNASTASTRSSGTRSSARIRGGGGGEDADPKQVKSRPGQVVFLGESPKPTVVLRINKHLGILHHAYLPGIADMYVLPVSSPFPPATLLIVEDRLRCRPDDKLETCSILMDKVSISHSKPRFERERTKAETRELEAMLERAEDEDEVEAWYAKMKARLEPEDVDELAILKANGKLTQAKKKELELVQSDSEQRDSDGSEEESESEEDEVDDSRARATKAKVRAKAKVISKGSTSKKVGRGRGDAGTEEDAEQDDEEDSE